MIWYASYVCGYTGAKQLSRAIGKGDNTLSKWIGEQPGFDLSRAVADKVGVSPMWLHDPTGRDAVEPEWFRNWLRQQRIAAQEATEDIPTERPGDIRPAQPISGMGSVPPGVPVTPDVPQQKKGRGGR